MWYKDEREISVDEKHDFKDGICTLLITEVGDYKCKMYTLVLHPTFPPKPETRFCIPLSWAFVVSYF